MGESVAPADGAIAVGIDRCRRDRWGPLPFETGAVVEYGVVLQDFEAFGFRAADPQKTVLPRVDRIDAAGVRVTVSSLLRNLLVPRMVSGWSRSARAKCKRCREYR